MPSPLFSFKKRLNYFIVNKRIVVIVLFSLVITSCKKETDKNSNHRLFKELSSSQSGLNFSNNLTENNIYNIVNYIYFYNGGGVAVGDINNDQLPDIYFTSNQQPNKLYLNNGDMRFTDITETAGVSGSADWSSGVSMIDINSDGYLDIYVCNVSGVLNLKGKNELFINNGDGTFTENAQKYGLDITGNSTQAYFFDYDKDNDLDVYLVKHASHTNTSHGPANIREKRQYDVGDMLLKNENNFYTDVSESAGIYGGANSYGLSAIISDFNDDGWEDIYVCNDFHENDYYYINQKNGKFKEDIKGTFAYTSRFSMGGDAADLNGDALPEIITVDMLPNNEEIIKESDGDVNYNIQNRLTSLGYHYQYSRNMLQVNEKHSFYETGLFSKIASTDWSWAPLFCDYDLDGEQDIYITNGIPKRPNNLDFINYLSNSFKKGSKRQEWMTKSLQAMPSGEASNTIFQGDGISFTNKTKAWSSNKKTISNGASYADLDLDGDLDMIVNNLNANASLLENKRSNKNNQISIHFKYLHGNINGIGTKVTIYTGNKQQSKELQISRGYLSSVEPILYFGLGHEKQIDSILVRWPNNTVQNIVSPKVNQRHKIEYIPSDKLALAKEKENTIVIENLIDFEHREDKYNDFDKERLIPYLVSKQGPAIAIGDINNDGFEDVFLGNASGAISKVFKGHSSGFTALENISIENDSLFEDVDASFIDIDNDNDLDLYIVSGINNQEAKFKKDRLYLNNGNGVFTKKSNALPDMEKFNGGSVRICDFNNDGLMDIFVGARSGKSFGTSANSYILKNNGNQQFEINQVINNLPFVTDAIWHDVNKDGWSDLFICSEWSPIQFYLNNKGKLIDATDDYFKDEKSGLWQHIALFDIDNDNDLDLIAGNWGENNKLQKYIDNDISLYIADFDNNGDLDPLITYIFNNKERTLNSKNELGSQMPMINKKYVSYHDFSTEDFSTIFDLKTVKNLKKRTINTISNGYFEFKNGKFITFKKLKPQMQLSALRNSFIYSNNESKTLITTGNINNLTPYFGKINSFNLNFLGNKKALKPFNPVELKRITNNLTLENPRIKVIETESQRILLIITNDSKIQTLIIKK